MDATERTAEGLPAARRIHRTAQGFDRVADLYDRSRPGYPLAAIEAMVARLQVGEHRRILELGAGTGKLTLPLLATGAHVVAVEPMPAMRDQLTANVPPEQRDHLEVVDTSAESLPLEAASVDGAVAAQSFHWFDPLPALNELHRVLRPDSWFAVVHNRRDLTSGPQAAMDDLLRPHRGATPSWMDATWSEVLDDPPGFTSAELLSFPHTQRLNADGFVGRVASVSFVARLPTPTHREVLDAARLLFTMLARDGGVDLDYVTEVRLLHRRDG